MPYAWEINHLLPPLLVCSKVLQHHRMGQLDLFNINCRSVSHLLYYHDLSPSTGEGLPIYMLVTISSIF